MYKAKYVTRDMLKKALDNNIITIELEDKLPNILDRKDKYSKRMVKLLRRTRNE